MAAAGSNPDTTYCPVHKIFEKDINDVKKRQEDRPCPEHTIRLSTLEKSDADQWDAISDLRKTVWGWKGGMALAGFLGSIIGAGAITLIIHQFIKG